MASKYHLFTWLRRSLRAAMLSFDRQNASSSSHITSISKLLSGLCSRSSMHTIISFFMLTNSLWRRSWWRQLKVRLGTTTFKSVSETEGKKQKGKGRKPSLWSDHRGRRDMLQAASGTGWSRGQCKKAWCTWCHTAHGLWQRGLWALPFFVSCAPSSPPDVCGCSSPSATLCSHPPPLEKPRVSLKVSRQFKNISWKETAPQRGAAEVQCIKCSTPCDRPRCFSPVSSWALLPRRSSGPVDPESQRKLNNYASDCRFCEITAQTSVSLNSL